MSQWILLQVRTHYLLSVCSKRTTLTDASRVTVGTLQSATNTHFAMSIRSHNIDTQYKLFKILGMYPVAWVSFTARSADPSDFTLSGRITYKEDLRNQISTLPRFDNFRM